MTDVSDDAEQTPNATRPAPSPQMFARPGAPGTERAPGRDTAEGTAGPGTADVDVDGATSRFASTGDPQVDRALAQLPDPADHHLGSEQPTDASTEGSERRAGAELPAHGGEETEPPTGIDLPDPALLDAHLADVTSVHRQLQQRLSDLSG